MDDMSASDMATPGDDASNGEPMPLSAALEGVMRSLRGPGSDAVRGVFGEWETLVGTAIADNVRPVRLSEGVLTVEVDEPAWATQFRFLADGVRERLLNELGVRVVGIDVRVAGRRGGGLR